MSRVVKNRYHYFVRKTFDAAHPQTEFDLTINVPFPVDDIVVRDVANADQTHTPFVFEVDGVRALHVIPSTYTYLLHMEGIGTLCSFTDRCCTRLDTVIPGHHKMISGAQRFKVTKTDGTSPIFNEDFASDLVVHLEFIIYEKM